MKPDLLPTKLNSANFSRHRSLFRQIAVKFGTAMLAMLAATILIWALVPLAEGDAATRILQARGVENPSELEITQTRLELNLDQPKIVQYFAWLGRALQGDLSISYQSGKPVASEIAARLPATLLLATVALILSFCLSLSAALLSVACAGRIADKLILLVTQAAAAMPAFLLGLLLLQFLVIDFGIGRIVATASLTDVWLPALCLSIGRAADWAQILRTNLLAALNSDYVFVATARGASQWRILWRYALPNALLPFLAVAGVGVGSLLGGAAIIETVFSWDGIGSYAVAAIAARDLPAVQGFILVSTLFYILSSFTIDWINFWIDPRLRA